MQGEKVLAHETVALRKASLYVGSNVEHWSRAAWVQAVRVPE